MVLANPACVYILTNFQRTVLYIGVTTDLIMRIAKHRDGAFGGFTTKYKCHFLIYLEGFHQMEDAIAREKQIKGWRRERKIQLIGEINPTWVFYEPEEMVANLLLGHPETKASVVEGPSDSLKEA